MGRQQSEGNDQIDPVILQAMIKGPANPGNSPPTVL
jgi:hypothetical protein